MLLIKIIGPFVYILIAFVALTSSSSKKNLKSEPSKEKDDDMDIDPYRVIEEGCPMVAERSNLNITKLDGVWTIPFASLNWLADTGMAIYNHSVKMSQVITVCPRVIISHLPPSFSNQTNGTEQSSNALWTLKFLYPKLKGAYQLRCWTQYDNTQSKFVCWNDKESRDLYLMISATDHQNWILLIRCSPSEPNAPSEGMSWVILSKQIPIDQDIVDVLFGVLDGYGFDVDEFKTQLFYDNCTVT